MERARTGECLKHPEAFWADALRLEVERFQMVSECFLVEEQREWAMNSFKEGRHAARIQTSEDRCETLRPDFIRQVIGYVTSICLISIINSSNDQQIVNSITIVV